MQQLFLRILFSNVFELGYTTCRLFQINQRIRKMNPKPYIYIINAPDNAISDIEKSRHFNRFSFISMSSSQADDVMGLSSDSEIAVVFIDDNNQDCFEKIASIARDMVDLEIIAAVDPSGSTTGLNALRRWASDFMMLPASARILDFYINRALERIYLHSHLCFNENCYKSRYARSQQNYQQLFNEVPCFVFVQDGDYHIAEANRKFEEYFGHQIGEYCFGIMKNRDEPCRECPVRKTITDGISQSCEMEIISSDGVKHVVLCYTAPLQNRHGQITKALVVLMDITEARLLEDHLTSLGFMIGSISHGIKGLLTNLDGGLYLIESGLNSNRMEKIWEGFEMTKDMTSRIKKLVLDILYYTKTRTLEWETVSCKQFMKDTFSLVDMKARKNNIQMDFSFESVTENDAVAIDKGSLQTALVNILENGIEACIDDSQDLEKEHTLGLHARVDKEKLTLRIQDNGHGMDNATLKNIFTIFFSSKGNKGTGLGLFIANKVISQHRGEIKVVSTINKGTKFIIKMPRVAPIAARQLKAIS